MKQYIKSDKYKAYKAKYYAHVRAMRRRGHKTPKIVYTQMNTVSLDEILANIIHVDNTKPNRLDDEDLITRYYPKQKPTSILLDPRNLGFSRRMISNKVKSVRFLKRQKEFVLPIMRIFRRRYGNLDEGLENDFKITFDILFPTLNQKQKSQNAPQLAEFIVFEVLNEKGLYDPKKFQNASLLGHLPIFQRTWLSQSRYYKMNLGNN